MADNRKIRMKLIGRREYVDFPALSLVNIEAKIDTGAYTSSIHVESITVHYEDNKPVLYFTVEQDGLKSFRFEDFGQKVIKNSFGEMEERYVIRTVFKIGKRKIRSLISLSNRDNMRFPVLIGRRLIKGKYLIDVKKIHTGGIGLRKAIKMYKTA
jgi:hypothetical protein